MGSNTFKSIGNKPLQKRMNYVLTKNNLDECKPKLKICLVLDKSNRYFK